MRDTGRTFSPGISDIFWCMACNLPTFSEKCICGSLPCAFTSLRHQTFASAPLLAGIGSKELFNQDYGCSDLLGERIILLNKIAGIDRRDQVFLDGYHIATLWFDIITGSYKLDLELAGAVLLAKRAKKSVLTCSEAMLKGHIKGKWIKSEFIQDQPPDLVEGDNVILRIGKFTGTGVVRKREDGSRSIRVKEVTQQQFQLSDRVPTLDDVIRANQAHLLSLEKRAIKELKDYLSRTRLPVNISFSGGKDSLAAAILALKVKPRAEMLFINTQLEFPETLQYVREFCRSHKLRLHEIVGKSSFFEQVQSFGPPAKDFRWCCKTNKLGPMTSFIQEHYPNGCVTIEGRRIYESFNRAKIGFVERNPYVPNQTTLSPIRDWRALEVMLYIRCNGLEPNPLYDMDFERIGCWLCPAQLQSEFAGLRKSHPQLYEQWTGLLNSWAEENRSGPAIRGLGILALEEAPAQDAGDRSSSQHRSSSPFGGEEGHIPAGSPGKVALRPGVFH